MHGSAKICVFSVSGQQSTSMLSPQGLHNSEPHSDSAEENDCKNNKCKPTNEWMKWGMKIRMVGSSVQLKNIWQQSSNNL